MLSELMQWPLVLSHLLTDTTRPEALKPAFARLGSPKFLARRPAADPPSGRLTDPQQDLKFLFTFDLRQPAHSEGIPIYACSCAP